ncbi:MAG: hypothetical protein G01um10143_571 [Parcubacteria group bacterium Gr01-1014_3]|nr:MAG: hypothetical protein G01um10143_571 [Parcubacteria group bacterium Gr01-1014_3]
MVKNPKNIIGVLLAISLFGIVIWLAQPSPTDQQANINANLAPDTVGALVLEEKSFDFGSISMAKGKVRHQFQLKNLSSDPVVIERITTSCMCTLATFTRNGESMGPFGMPGHGAVPKINQTLAANEEVVIDVAFDPAAHGPSGVGRIERIVFLENSVGNPLEIKISATVEP